SLSATVETPDLSNWSVRRLAAVAWNALAAAASCSAVCPASLRRGAFFARRFDDSAMRLPQGRKRPWRTRRRLKHTRTPNRCPTEGASRIPAPASQRTPRRSKSQASSSGPPNYGCGQRAHCARADSPPTLSPWPLCGFYSPPILLSRACNHCTRATRRAASQISASCPLIARRADRIAFVACALDDRRWAGPPERRLFWPPDGIEVRSPA